MSSWLVDLVANAVTSLAILGITIYVALQRVRSAPGRWRAAATGLLFLGLSVVFGLRTVRVAGSLDCVSQCEPPTAWSTIAAQCVTALAAVATLGVTVRSSRSLSGSIHPDQDLSRRLMEPPQRLQAESAARALAESERDFYATMMKSIYANSHTLNYVKDLDGRYLMVNASFEKAFGVKEAELIGLTDVAIDPTMAAVWRVHDIRATKELYRVEETAQTPTGSRVFDSVKFPVYDREGMVYATCGISLDVTEQRIASATLAEARDTALAANEAKSAFLATMSHEIRTPMNAVIGMTDLLLDTTMDAEQTELLSIVRSSGSALLALINDVLDFSKIEAGQFTLAPRAFNLRDAVESCVDLVAYDASAKNLDLVCYVENDCPNTIFGDEGRISQVILNLVANAVKFTDTGDVFVNVATGQPVDGRQTVTITVADSGIGISPAGLLRLFTSFTQVAPLTAHHHQGTGLGLAISQHLARTMDGDVTVVSTEGHGSTFTATLMVGAVPDGCIDEHAQSSTPTSSLTGRSALIVDSQTVSARVLKRRLEDLGMQITTVPSASMAQALLADGSVFDLLIVSLQTPQVDVERLQNAGGHGANLTQMPIIWLSNVGKHHAGQPGIPEGTLMKPVQSAALIGSLHSALNAHRTDVALGRGRPRPNGRVGRSLRVLLAEDNVVNQRVAQLMLTKLHHMVDTVSNGLEAVEAVGKNAYDVVLLDIQMPVMDGLEAAQRIRLLSLPVHQPRLIAMTASAMSTDREACAAAGMDSFLSKPVRLVDIRSALEEFDPGARPDLDVSCGSPDPDTTRDQLNRSGSDSSVDLSVIDALRKQLDDFDGVRLARLTTDYLTEGETSLTELTAALDDDDAEKVISITHRWASSSMLLGAIRLATLLNAAGQTARVAPATLDGLVEPIRAEYNLVAISLCDGKARLQSRPPMI